MNPFMLLSALVALGFPAVYTLQARGGLRGLRPRASWHEGSKAGGMSAAEAAALEAARQEGAAGAGTGGGDDLGALLAALLQGRTEGIGITTSDFGQQLAAIESGAQNYYDGAGYPPAPDVAATTTKELVTSGTGGTQPPATTSSGGFGGTTYGSAGGGWTPPVSIPGYTPAYLQQPSGGVGGLGSKAA